MWDTAVFSFGVMLYTSSAGKAKLVGEVCLWKDSSVLILQMDPNSVHVGFSSGPLLKLNNEEGGEPVKACPRAFSWRTIFQY